MSLKFLDASTSKMVYYIRFLKPPTFDSSKGIVRALVTVTTDLGDDFYPGSLTLFAVAVTSASGWQPVWHKVEWKRGMRTVWIEIQGVGSSPLELLRLVVNSRPSLLADDISLESMPDVFSARSSSFGQINGGKMSQADNCIERRYKTGRGGERVIDEEIGESIARHIW